MPIEKPSVGLTMFLDFTMSNPGTPRANLVRRMKSSRYFPAMDYWKQLREEIKHVHLNDLSLEELNKVVEKIPTERQDNYRDMVRSYKRFARNKDIQWFEPGKSHWDFDNRLFVRSTPELGLIINGTPTLIKLYFKGKKKRVNKNLISSGLALLNESSYENDFGENEPVKSLLNIHKARLYDLEEIENDHLISLESDAEQLLYLWDKV